MLANALYSDPVLSARPSSNPNMPGADQVAAQYPTEEAMVTDQGELCEGTLLVLTEVFLGRDRIQAWGRPEQSPRMWETHSALSLAKRLSSFKIEIKG